jgi:serine phosphatase RsbU (regulator of sigma subunit)/anti-sigma regulatory factor (Ser/Thr protein kinase)
MFRRPIKEINAEFSAEEKYLDSIQRTVRESCIAAGMSRADTSSVLLAMEEGATNVIRHAYLYEKGILRLRIVIYRKLVVFSLIDFGRSFQPGQAGGKVNLQKLVESGRKGGLGFYMIQKIMDSVEYIPSAGQNELRMIKRIGGERTEGLPLLRRMFTLRVKFSFWTMFIVVVIIGGSFYYTYKQTMRQAHENLDETVYSLTKTIADQAAGYHINRRSDVEYDELIVSYMRANPELRLIVLTDSSGFIRAHSEDIRNIGKQYEMPGFVPEQTDEMQPHRYFERDEPLSYLMMPIMSGQRQIGTVHVSYSSAHLWQAMAETRSRIAALTLGLLLLGVLGVFMLSNYFVNPIVKITQRVRKFTSGDLESELPLEGAEEFFEISRAFNEMMSRVSQDKKNIIEREKLAKEIEVASHIQKTLLPAKVPRLPGMEVDTFYRAASVIGGDLYDIFEICPGRYCLVVADVSGKGVPASLVMSILRTVIRIYATDESSPRAILGKVDRYLEGNIPSGMFITVMLVIYDVASAKLNLVSAGHNPMIYFDSKGSRLMKLNPAGTPLGVPLADDVDFESALEETEIVLSQEDMIAIFTDGITEALDRDKNQFGMKRLMDFFGTAVSNGSRPPVTELSNELVRAIDDFAGFSSQADDITFIIARATAEGENAPKPTELETRRIESDE